jgi:hypothetical protein
MKRICAKDMVIGDTIADPIRKGETMKVLSVSIPRVEVTLEDCDGEELKLSFNSHESVVKV